ncbi:13853_t:CDS:2 [Funneliformis mosseae]|uniref:13853_t:CDS:1 n=1 Tax=Funneliformis mosseae TaxID=27381 RepID=A0A9N9G649_FUNMO|nr:13853_t:CDS:2 [Funneliformis mosseae]
MSTKTEKELSVSLDSRINEDMKGLLKVYDDAIIEVTVSYHVNLPQIAVILNQNSLIDLTTYSFSRDWPCK